MSQTLDIEQLLPRPSFGDIFSTTSACFLLVFFLLYAVVKQTPVLFFHTTQLLVWKCELSVFLKDTTI